MPNSSDDLNPNDRLFVGGEPDWWNEACLDWSHDKWSSYVEGYRLAGDAIVERVTSTRSYQDFLVYPALFLYRQYLELELKGIIRDARRLLDEPGGMPKGHKIQGLWDACSPLVRRIFPNDSPCQLTQLGRLIREFATHDVDAQAFRYPVDVKGNATLADLDRINLRNASDVMGKMSILLGGVSAALDEYLTYKLEMEHEASMDSL